MLVINQNEVAELLAMESCITVMESVLKDLSAGQAIQKLKTSTPAAPRQSDWLNAGLFAE